MTIIIKKYKFSLAIACIIAVLSLIPVSEQTPLDDVPFIDKWVHFIMYASLSGAMWLDFKGHKHKLSWKRFLMIFMLPSIYGGLLELAQAHLTSCRSGEWMDFYADSFGALLGAIVGHFASTMRKII